MPIMEYLGQAPHQPVTIDKTIITVGTVVIDAAQAQNDGETVIDIYQRTDGGYQQSGPGNFAITIAIPERRATPLDMDAVRITVWPI